MKKNKGRETRARIAAIALELLREKGSSGLTMRQVAARAGLSLSNVQYHFKSREQLLNGITDHHLELCQEAMQGAVLRAGEVTLRSVLVASLCDEAVRASALAFRELFALARFEQGVQERLMDHYRMALDGLAALLSEIASHPEEKLLEVAALLLTSLEGTYLLAGAMPVSAERLALQLEETARRMLGC